MATTKSKPEVKPTLADVSILDTEGFAYDGAWFVPMVRFGGPKELASHLRGLAGLLFSDRDGLTRDEMDFVYKAIHNLATALTPTPHDDEAAREYQLELPLPGRLISDLDKLRKGEKPKDGA